MINQIVLVSKEGIKSSTSSLISNLSGLIYNVLQDYPENEEIPLPFVANELLVHILSFANHHNFTPPEPPKKPVVSSNLTDEWDVTFIDQFNEDQIIELVLATNYLDLKSLLDICLVKLACKFKDKTAQDIRRDYNIEEELTPEVEEKLKAEFPWAMEGENAD